eukprot:173118_1
MASRVLWLLFSLWAVFLPMFAFAAEHNANDVKGYGAIDERTDDNFIDWMGMSREDFIRKYPPGKVYAKGFLASTIGSGNSAMYALDGRDINVVQDRKELSVGMSVQLCDALPGAIENGNPSAVILKRYLRFLKIARKVLNDKAKSLMKKEDGLKHERELYRRISLLSEARVMFQLCLKGRGDATDHEIEMIRIRLGSAKNLINEGKDRIRGYKRDLKRKRTNSWICLIASLVGMLLFVVSMCKFRRVV